MTLSTTPSNTDGQLDITAHHLPVPDEQHIHIYHESYETLTRYWQLSLAQHQKPNNGMITQPQGTRQDACRSLQRMKIRSA